MKAISDILILGVAALAGVLAVLNYYWFATARTATGAYDLQGTTSQPYLYYAIGATIVACVALVFYFLRHVNKEEEIHITR